MSTPTATESVEPQANEAAFRAESLAAAQKYFPNDSQSSDSDEPLIETKPAAKTTDEKPKTTDLIGSVIKKPGAPDTKPAAETPPPVEDVDKGLQAPPENAKSRAGWEELKKRATSERDARIAAEKKAADLEAKVKTSPAGIDEATRARLTELETQNKTYSERLKVLDLKSHPEFNAQFVAPANAAKAALANIAKQDEVDVDVEALLSLKGKAFNKGVSEAMDQMTPYARVQFQSQLDGYIKAQLGADQALAQADEFLKTAKQNGGAKSRAVFDQTANGYREHFIPMQVDAAADAAVKAEADDYNGALAGITKTAEAYAFGNIDERAVADLAHKAALYDFTLSRGLPRIEKLFGAEISARDTKIAELEKQVKTLTAVSPALNSSSGGGSSGTPPGTEENHLDAARKFKWA